VCVNIGRDNDMYIANISIDIHVYHTYKDTHREREREIYEKMLYIVKKKLIRKVKLTRTYFLIQTAINTGTPSYICSSEMQMEGSGSLKLFCSQCPFGFWNSLN
jgi:hypothetical protein